MPTKFFIGAQEWPGITKLIEEAGEVVQVCGKLMATDGRVDHWEGSDLGARLEDEIGDVLAAAEFVIAKSALRLSRTRVESRRKAKLKAFEAWHQAQTVDSDEAPKEVEGE